jgi:hypothetical protein
MSKHHILARGIVFCNDKRHIVTSDVVYGVVNDMFHGVLIVDGVYKVEV